MQDIDQTFEGDNSVMMQQVSKALLETASKSTARLAPPQVADASLTDHNALRQLLKYRSALKLRPISGNVHRRDLGGSFVSTKTSTLKLSLSCQGGSSDSRNCIRDEDSQCSYCVLR